MSGDEILVKRTYVLTLVNTYVLPTFESTAKAKEKDNKLITFKCPYYTQVPGYIRRNSDSIYDRLNIYHYCCTANVIIGTCKDAGNQCIQDGQDAAIKK